MTKDRGATTYVALQIELINQLMISPLTKLIIKTPVETECQQSHQKGLCHSPIPPVIAALQQVMSS